MATYVYAPSWGAASGYAFKFRAFLTYEVITNNETTYAVKFTAGVQCSTTDAVGWDGITCTTKEGTTQLNTKTARYSTNDADSSARQVYITTFTRTWTKGKSAQTKTVSATVTGSGITSTTASKPFSVPAKKSYTVTYDANGGSGAPASQTKWYSTALTLSSAVPTKTGYNFSGWLCSANGLTYQAGASLPASINQACTLTAQWTLKTYTITYVKSSESASGTIADGTKTYGVGYTLADGTGFTWSLHSVESWNTKYDGTGTRYEVGGTYTANEDVTLYAQWVLDYVKPTMADVEIYRVDAGGDPSDIGEFIHVGFSYVGGHNPGESETAPYCVITIDGTDVRDASDGRLSASPFSDYYGDESVVPPVTYSRDAPHTVTVRLYDDNDSTGVSETRIVPTSVYPIDLIGSNQNVYMGVMHPAVSNQVLTLPDGAVVDGDEHLHMGSDATSTALNTAITNSGITGVITNSLLSMKKLLTAILDKITTVTSWITSYDVRNYVKVTEHTATTSLSVSSGSSSNTTYTVTTTGGWKPIGIAGWRVANGSGSGGSYALPFTVSLNSASTDSAVVRVGIRAVGGAVSNCTLYVSVLWLKNS